MFSPEVLYPLIVVVVGGGLWGLAEYVVRRAELKARIDKD